MNFNYLAFAALLFFFSLPLSGAEIFSDKVESFSLKPQVCIVKKAGDDCELVTKVQWKVSEVMELCLIKDGEKLQCWQEKKMIEQTLAIMLKATSKILLVDGKNITLAAEVLEVNAVNPKQKRRRLRPAWSLF